MAKLRLKTLRVKNNSAKTIGECYSEYMDYCKAIGQREGTLISKNRFYTYELLKLSEIHLLPCLLKMQLIFIG